MFDYHVHSEFSVDCRVPMADSCRAAIEAGVTEIAFTDHIDHEPVDLGFGYWNAEAYFARSRQSAPSSATALTVLAGAEVDFNSGIAARSSGSSQAHQFDFVIGSVHYARGGVDLPRPLQRPDVGRRLRALP